MNKLIKLINLSIPLMLIMPAVHSQSTMSDLVHQLKRDSVIKSDIVLKTMLRVDRKYFCPRNPYMDAPQSIGYGATISAPHMHAYVLELLKEHLGKGRKALDIGSGSGYVTVCMALLLREGGVATGIDHIPELIQEAYKNTKAHFHTLVTRKKIKYVTRDGRLGYPAGAPYDVIHCGANFDKVPTHIIDQLKPGGRFIGPIAGNYRQYLTIIDKKFDGTITEKRVMAVMYLPMQDKVAQMGWTP